MKNRVERPDKEGRVKSKPVKKSNYQVTHPIIQLQQTVGNKAVANIIQLEKDSENDKGLFRLVGIETNNKIQTKLIDKLRGSQEDQEEKWQNGDMGVKSGADSDAKWQGGGSGMMSGGESDAKWQGGGSDMVMGGEFDQKVNDDDSAWK